MFFLDLEWYEIGIRGFFAIICKLVYPIISMMYNLFIFLCQTNILTTEEINPIYQRVTIILTIVMVFYITFQFVRYVLEPAALTDKEKGASKVVFKLVIVILLIAFVPRIFVIAQRFQNILIKNNVISNVIIGPQTTDVDNVGLNFSKSIFEMFYYVEPGFEEKNCFGALSCKRVVSNTYDYFTRLNSLDGLSVGLGASSKNDNGNVAYIHFEADGLLPVIVGVVVVYMLFLYCIDIGTRWAQLIYLQIVAPIAIIGYLSPKKDNVFQKWLKQCITTYLDMFLRVAIISLVMLICQILVSVDADFIPSEIITNHGGYVMYIRIALILGVMAFAHRVPGLLKDLFPGTSAASGTFGLSWKDSSLNKAFGTGKRFAGAAVGGAAGALAGTMMGAAQGFRRRNALKEVTDENGNKKMVKAGVGAGLAAGAMGALGGAVSGAGRGLWNGAKKGNTLKNISKGMSNQRQESQRFGNMQENGYGLGDQIVDRGKAFFGARSRVEMKEQEKKPLEAQNKVVGNLESQGKKMGDRAEDKVLSNPKTSIQRAYTAAKDNLEHFSENKRSLYISQRKADAMVSDVENSAVAKIDKSKFKKTIYDEDAYRKAFNDAIIAGKDTRNINRADYTKDIFDTNAYDAAVQNAKNSINRGDILRDFIVSADEAAAQQAYDDAYNAAKADLQTKKDAASSDYKLQAYINADGDPSIKQAVRDTEHYLQLWNSSAPVGQKIGIYAYKVDPNTGKKTDEIDHSLIDENGKIIINTLDDMKAFEDFFKADLSTIKNANNSKIIDINNDIEIIKSQQSGSGIGDGKK